MFRVGLQTLIIIWWLGAVTAAFSLLIRPYSEYVLIGSSSWIVVMSTTGLIIYEIKRIKKEDRTKELAR